MSDDATSRPLIVRPDTPLRTITDLLERDGFKWRRWVHGVYYNFALRGSDGEIVGTHWPLPSTTDERAFATAARFALEGALRWSKQRKPRVVLDPNPWDEL